MLVSVSSVEGFLILCHTRWKWKLSTFISLTARLEILEPSEHPLFVVNTSAGWRTPALQDRACFLLGAGLTLSLSLLAWDLFCHRCIS